MKFVSHTDEFSYSNSHKIILSSFERGKFSADCRKFSNTDSRRTSYEVVWRSLIPLLWAGIQISSSLLHSAI